MSTRFTDAQIAGFLRRSYFAVDGLWFVKNEERLGTEVALELDEAVWGVMSKVQARKARALLGIEGNSLAELVRAFELKLSSEGHDYEAELSEDEAALTIRVCPWYEILKTSGRTHLAGTIADRICMREFAGWVKEFGSGTEIAFGHRLCVDQCKTCRIVFRKAES